MIGRSASPRCPGLSAARAVSLGSAPFEWEVMDEDVPLFPAPVIQCSTIFCSSVKVCFLGCLSASKSRLRFALPSIWWRSRRVRRGKSMRSLIDPLCRCRSVQPDIYRRSILSFRRGKQFLGKHQLPSSIQNLGSTYHRNQRGDGSHELLGFETRQARLNLRLGHGLYASQLRHFT